MRRQERNPAPTTPGPATAFVSTDQLVDRLERLMQDQIALHDSLLTVLKRKREAIARADADAIARYCRDENELLAQYSVIDERRSAAATEIAASVDRARREPFTLREVAELVGGDRGAQLLALRDRAQVGIAELKRASGVLATAAAALGGHIAGVMHRVQATLGRSRIYERRGRIACGAAVRSTVDITS